MAVRVEEQPGVIWKADDLWSTICAMEYVFVCWLTSIPNSDATEMRLWLRLPEDIGVALKSAR